MISDLTLSILLSRISVDSASSALVTNCSPLANDGYITLRTVRMAPNTAVISAARPHKPYRNVITLASGAGRASASMRTSLSGQRANYTESSHGKTRNSNGLLQNAITDSTHLPEWIRKYARMPQLFLSYIDHSLWTDSVFLHHLAHERVHAADLSCCTLPLVHTVLDFEVLRRRVLFERRAHLGFFFSFAVAVHSSKSCTTNATGSPTDRGPAYYTSDVRLNTA